MRGGCGDDGVGAAEISVSGGEAVHEARQGAGAYRDMGADLHVARAQCAGRDPESLAGIGVGDPEQLVGQQFAEAAMISRAVRVRALSRWRIIC